MTDEMDLMALWTTLWRGRWLVVAVTTISAVLSTVYAFTATEWFRAEALLTSADPSSTPVIGSELGALGGLASLAGISIGDNDISEPLAVLTSRELTRSFIEELDLLPVLFAEDWDATAGRWKNADPRDWPDLRDGVEYFDEEIRAVREDKKRNLVTVSIEWIDPNVAADWTNRLVERLNERMRERSLAEAEANVSYLQKELARTNVVKLQQSIGRLLEIELQKVMLARASKGFAFRIIDPAEAPKRRSRPKRAQLIALAIFTGAMVGVFAVFLLHALGRDLGGSAAHAKAS